MYTIVEWTDQLDLTDFYEEAGKRGFNNNSSQAAMIDCFSKELEWAAWILYQDNKAVGSVAAHSFSIMGEGAYRVLARTCAFASARLTTGLITPSAITKHQNLTDQFLLPTCIEWARGKKIFATSNESAVASQRLVHRHYFPALARLGIVERICDINYRSTDQTVWQIHPDKFLANLELHPRWV
jgi:hypothetical protein